jgi:copper resistance protein B
MKLLRKQTVASTLLISAQFTPNLYAAGADDPLLTMVKLDQFEHAEGDHESADVLEGYAWMGYDLDKLWLKVEAERAEGEFEEAELQLLYGRAITPFWNFQAGLRADIEPSPNRNWAVVGFQGVAPYFLETEAAFFVGESGDFAARLSAEYELLITQKLILAPEMELNFYGQEDLALGIGSGLSDADFGLRLRYEIRREFAPYIGINWTGKFGETAGIAEGSGEPSSDTQIVLGLRAWF